MLEQYKDLPFVDRVLNPQNYPKPTKFDEQGRPQTHLLAADQDEKSGDWIVWPKLTVKNGKYVEQSFADAKASGDVINFGKEKDAAIGFSKNYKTKEFEDFYRQKKAKGDAVNYLQANNLQSAIDMLQKPDKSNNTPDVPDVGSIKPISGSEVFEAGLLNKISSDPVFNKIQKLLGVTKKTIEDPFTYLGGPIIGKAGKLTLAELSKEITKHNRIQSLLRSGAPGDIKEAKKLQKSLVIKNPNEADDLYLKALKETENADDFYKSLSVTNPNIMDPMTPLKVSKTGFDKIDSSLNTLRGLRVVEDQALFGNLKGKFKRDDYKKLRQSQKQTAKEIQDELNKLSLEDSKVIQETFEIEDVMDIFGDVYKDLN
tara:strand:- start:126 stop:1238 length:1113 start_codon:yes stop_codon:yes gene_type:complete